MRYVGYNPITTPGGVAGSKAVKRRPEVRFVMVALVHSTYCHLGGAVPHEGIYFRP